MFSDTAREKNKQPFRDLPLDNSGRPRKEPVARTAAIVLKPQVLVRARLTHFPYMIMRAFTETSPDFTQSANVENSFGADVLSVEPECVSLSAEQRRDLMVKIFDEVERSASSFIENRSLFEVNPYEQYFLPSSCGTRMFLEYGLSFGQLGFFVSLADLLIFRDGLSKSS